MRMNMKKGVATLLIFFFVFASFLVVANPAEAASRVKGYTKKNGTYVAPHYKSSPNKSKFDNFSTKGNINPYTVKKGTVNPYKITPKKYK